ncbi:MAG: type II toxin-antitoxin system HicB family antitoxin [Sphaerospermopsis kisseleviana]
MKFVKQSLEYYLNLKYSVTLYPDAEQGGYVAEIKDLPGCLTQGETLEEIITNINEARELWIETAYEAGDNIPLPSEKNIINDPLAEFIGAVEHGSLAQNIDQELYE